MFDVVVMFDSAVVVAFNIPIKIKLCMLSLLDYLHDRMILSPNQINRVCSPYWIIYTYGVINYEDNSRSCRNAVCIHT